MNLELLSKLNWVDVLVIIVFLRSIYIGLKRGLIVEFFKLLGVIVAIVVSFHYYSHIADFLNAKSPLPLDLADFVSLLFLSALIIVLFKFIRDGFNVLVKAEVKSFFDKFAGFILSLLRAFSLSSLTLIILFSTNLDYLKSSVNDSSSKNYLMNIAPRIYSSCFESFLVKFFPKEELNTTIFDALEIEQKISKEEEAN